MLIIDNQLLKYIIQIIAATHDIFFLQWNLFNKQLQTILSDL